VYISRRRRSRFYGTQFLAIKLILKICYLHVVIVLYDLSWYLLYWLQYLLTLTLIDRLINWWILNSGILLFLWVNIWISWAATFRYCQKAFIYSKPDDAWEEKASFLHHSYF
jgi:hypothetical protein